LRPAPHVRKVGPAVCTRLCPVRLRRAHLRCHVASRQYSSFWLARRLGHGGRRVWGGRPGRGGGSRSFIHRRGPVIDLVLARPRLSRSQFVFTETRGRPAIFWQTQKTARAAKPRTYPTCPSAPFRLQGFSSTPGSTTPTGSPDATSRRSGWRLRPGTPGSPTAETIAIVEPREPRGLALRRNHGLSRCNGWAGSEGLLSWSRGGTPVSSSLKHVSAAFITDGLVGCGLGTPKSGRVRRFERQGDQVLPRLRYQRGPKGAIRLREPADIELPGFEKHSNSDSRRSASPTRDVSRIGPATDCEALRNDGLL
jgi:hypothetical protein